LEHVGYILLKTCNYPTRTEKSTK